MYADINNGKQAHCITFTFIFSTNLKRKKKKKKRKEKKRKKKKKGSCDSGMWTRRGGRIYSLNSRDLFLNLRRLVKMTKPFWV